MRQAEEVALTLEYAHVDYLQVHVNKSKSRISLDGTCTRTRVMDAIEPPDVSHSCRFGRERLYHQLTASAASDSVCSSNTMTRSNVAIHTGCKEHGEPEAANSSARRAQPPVTDATEVHDCTGRKLPRTCRCDKPPRHAELPRRRDEETCGLEIEDAP